MKTSLPQQNPTPKGGMEVGLLSVAVILVLFFVASAVMPQDTHGLKINKIGCVFGMTNDGTGSELDYVKVYSRDRIVFRDEEYTETELKKFLSQVRLEKEKAYMIHSAPRVEFGLIITIHDLIRQNGIGEDYVFIGGVMYDGA